MRHVLTKHHELFSFETTQLMNHFYTLISKSRNCMSKNELCALSEQYCLKEYRHADHSGFTGKDKLLNYIRQVEEQSKKTPMNELNALHASLNDLLKKSIVHQNDVLDTVINHMEPISRRLNNTSRPLKSLTSYYIARSLPITFPLLILSLFWLIPKAWESISTLL